MLPRKRDRNGQARGHAQQQPQETAVKKTAANAPWAQPEATDNTPEIVRLSGDGGLQQSGNYVYSSESSVC